MKKVAIVTYNNIGHGQYDNGVHIFPEKELAVYIAQGRGTPKFAKKGQPNSLAAGATESQMESIFSRREGLIEQAFSSLAETLEEMDHSYIYVGAGGSEVAISATAHLPGEKVTYVLCDCNEDYKISMIRSLGNGQARIRMCECGGQETLEDIMNKLIN